MNSSLIIGLKAAIFLLNSWAFFTMFYKITQTRNITLKHQVFTVGVIAGVLALGISFYLRFILYPAIVLLLLLLSLFYKKLYKSRLTMSNLFFLSCYTVIIYSFTNELEELIARWLTQGNYEVPLTQLFCYFISSVINVFLASKAPSRGLEEIYFFATQSQLISILNVFLFLLIVAASQLFLFRHPQSWFMQLFFNDMTLFYLAFTVFIFGLILWMIFYTNAKWRSQTNDHLRSIKNYTQKIEHLNEELNMFRHDSLNILYSLELAIQKGEIEEIQRIYQEILVPSQQLLLDTQQQIEVLKRVKSMEVKSLLNAKLRQATAQKIDFSIVVTEDICFDCIPNLLIFIRILAILLDNALENSLKNEKPAVCLLITQDESTVKLVLQNTYDKNSLPLEQFHQKYFTSKKDKKQHGLGLTFVHQAIKYYSHYDLMTTVNQDFFTQELIIQKV